MVYKLAKVGQQGGPLPTQPVLVRNDPAKDTKQAQFRRDFSLIGDDSGRWHDSGGASLGVRPSVVVVIKQNPRVNRVDPSIFGHFQVVARAVNGAVAELALNHLIKLGSITGNLVGKWALSCNSCPRWSKRCPWRSPFEGRRDSRCLRKASYWQILSCLLLFGIFLKSILAPSRATSDIFSASKVAAKFSGRCKRKWKSPAVFLDGFLPLFRPLKWHF